MKQRNYTGADRILMGFDQALQTLFGKPHATDRPNPAKDLPDADLSTDQKRHSARLLRVDHTGEVCAQALYQGQALTARLPQVRDSMQRSAQEESDHLEWCHKRLLELQDRRSLLNPIWYTGSFAIGAAAGLAGDRWSLGFIAETERQVCAHLDSHLQQIPMADRKSRAILEQMKSDEQHHADVAIRSGGAPLPGPVKAAMRLSAKLMTKSTYWL
ncbi:MAG: 2-polyprenyl-3-methyl-6-methoxy-1,4-benzoquinone monooxygenase [Gammaproteobacteria bacterium]|nr:2-polyprenyl-3-methyl-6-methoxy-1,4-benzoquinone monooxygenase [Gammaproteobacteria bacterium]